MRAPKYRKRRDISELPQVKSLKKCGYEVHRKLPVDLLAFKWVTLEQLMRAPEERNGMFRLVTVLECKTPVTKKGTRAKRYDQEEQDQFCDRWAVPRVTSPMEALLAVGERVEVE